MTKTENRSGIDRIAGAPISWGVCEVPGWGYQLTPKRVLAEMREVGLSATEFGPDGFLPADPQEMADVLAAHHLTAVGGFAPVVMYRPDHDPIPDVERLIPGFLAAQRRDDGAVGGLRHGRLRQPTGAGREGLGHPAAQPGPDHRVDRRARHQGGAAPARGHDGGEHRRRSSACSTAPTWPCAWTPATC